MLRLLATLKNLKSFEATVVSSLSPLRFSKSKLCTPSKFYSTVNDSLSVVKETRGIIPSKTIVLTINDKVYQHVGANAHSTIISFGMEIGGKSKESSSVEGLSEVQSIKTLCKTIRTNMSNTLSSTFWQVNMINSKQIHFQCTRIPDANASILLNILIQLVIEFIESLQFRVKGVEVSQERDVQAYSYELSQSYCTCTPDARKAGLQTNSHFLIFRRKIGPYEVDSSVYGNNAGIETINAPATSTRRKSRRLKRRTVPRKTVDGVDSITKSSIERASPADLIKKSVSHGVGPEIPREIHQQMENLWSDK
ncbi:potassium voltage-gated channel protein [Perkinsela sp. CCAP 1560/4]|nr:potassium voltage-gated channel protein [Perkinsela sp. CCAP 1560/4]|eukprot:KNH05495.1 potassium voltage-gated channel protein [Perkinsela sp. CCAP 1560/4]